MSSGNYAATVNDKFIYCLIFGGDNAKNNISPPIIHEYCHSFATPLAHILLGIVGASEHDDLHEPEIFYELITDARGKGYATEATKAITA